MTNAKIGEYITNYVNMTLSQMDDAQCDLNSKVMQDPTYAVEHHSARLVKRAFEHRIWTAMAVPASQGLIAEALAYGRKQCMATLTASARSTCPFARAVAESQRDAASSLLDVIGQLENLLA